MTKEEQDKLFKLIDYKIMHLKGVDRVTLSQAVIDLWDEILTELKLEDV